MSADNLFPKCQTHPDQQVCGLCLDDLCNSRTELCCKCLTTSKLHVNHYKSIIYLEELTERVSAHIKQKIDPILQIFEQFQQKDLFQKLSQAIKIHKGGFEIKVEQLNCEKLNILGKKLKIINHFENAFQQYLKDTLSKISSELEFLIYFLQEGQLAFINEPFNQTQSYYYKKFAMLRSPTLENYISLMETSISAEDGLSMLLKIPSTNSQLFSNKDSYIKIYEVLKKKIPLLQKYEEINNDQKMQIKPQSQARADSNKSFIYLSPQPRQFGQKYP